MRLMFLENDFGELYRLTGQNVIMLMFLDDENAGLYRLTG